MLYICLSPNKQPFWAGFIEPDKHMMFCLACGNWSVGIRSTVPVVNYQAVVTCMDCGFYGVHVSNGFVISLGQAVREE